MNDQEFISSIMLILSRWRLELCVDCGAPIIERYYFRKCSEHPDTHKLGDCLIYLKEIDKKFAEYMKWEGEQY